MQSWLFVPILTEREAEKEFMARLVGASKVVLLFVVDQDNTGGVAAGLVGTRIKNAERIMEEIKKFMQKADKTTQVKDYVEWGAWTQKAVNTALLEQVEKAVMVKCAKANELAKELEKKKVKTELVSLPKASA